MEARRETELSLSWDEWQSTELSHSSVASWAWPRRYGMPRATEPKAEDCVTYILNWVQKSGCNGFCDDEIYGQAIHYYEEKDIEVGKPLNCQMSVNHHIELTEEEKAQARQEAIRQYQQEQMNKMRNRDTAKRTSQRTETEVHQPSLFDTLWNQERNIRSKS